VLTPLTSAALILSVHGAGAEEKPAARLSIDLLMEMESVAGPKISPDGARIVFTRTWNDRVNDQPQSELWIMERDGGRPRQLGEGSAPEWSPDGERIAFLREGKPKGAQIHVMWIATREVTQVTRVETAPSGVKWSPDGRRLAFQSVVPEKSEPLPITLPRRPEGAKWAEEPTIITRLNYRRDQKGYRPAGHQHLFVVDAEGGTPRQVTSGDFDHGPGEWSGDGSRLVFAGLRDEEADWKVFESDLYAVDVESGAVVNLTSRKGSESSPRVSPDGRWIAYLAKPDHDLERNSYDVAKLVVMRADGSEPQEVAGELDRDPGDLVWSRRSDFLYFTADDRGSRDVWCAEPRGSRATRVTAGTWRISALDADAGGGLVGVMTSPHVPSDVCAIPRPRGAPETVAPERLTRVNDDVLARLELAPVEELRWKAPDGLPIQGWRVTPPGFDPARRHPLVLQIHGGPHSMYGVEWSFERQYLAAQGFVVLYTNPRGSTGYGQAFGNAIKNAYPDKDYDDLMSGVDAALALGSVDPRQLFVYGGSGGGVLTAWIVGHTDRFAAAVSMFPVIDWISFVGTTDGPYWYHNFEKLPWEDVSEHWNRSPLKHVGNVKTPTLLITGELDLRTPMAQTEEYYQALKLLKVETAMIRIPDEYHGAAGRRVSNAMRRVLYVEAWFRKHMPAAGPTATTSAASGS